MSGPTPEVTVFVSPAYTAGGPDFDTTRKAAWVAASLESAPIGGVVLEAPAAATVERLAAIHSGEYIEAIRTGEPEHLAESSGFNWGPATFATVAASTGGAAAAALRAFKAGVAGSLSSGLHHARRGTGSGFCTFNGLALGAVEALGAGARGVLVIDLDAHCGGGTADILRGESRVRALDIAVSAFDRYLEPDGWTLDTLLHAEDYLPTLRSRLGAVDRDSLDLVIYNAGMDPFERCHVGGLRGITRELLAEREETVFAWAEAAGLPISFVLAGGYVNSGFERDELVGLHRLTIEAAARHAGARTRQARPTTPTSVTDS